MTSDRLRKRLLHATLALFIFVSLAGCNAIATTSSTDDPVRGIEYDLDYRCQDHESVGGDRVQTCTVDLTVSDLPTDIEYVQLHVSDAIDSETETYVITDVETTKFAVDKDRHYGDTVVLEAQLSDGDRTVLDVLEAQPSGGDRIVLENHTLSCEDVGYKDAC